MSPPRRKPFLAIAALLCIVAGVLSFLFLEGDAHRADEQETAKVVIPPIAPPSATPSPVPTESPVISPTPSTDVLHISIRPLDGLPLLPRIQDLEDTIEIQASTVDSAIFNAIASKVREGIPFGTLEIDAGDIKLRIRAIGQYMDVNDAVLLCDLVDYAGNATISIESNDTVMSVRPADLYSETPGGVDLPPMSILFKEDGTVLSFSPRNAWLKEGPPR